MTRGDEPGVAGTRLRASRSVRYVLASAWVVLVIALYLSQFLPDLG